MFNQNEIRIILNEFEKLACITKTYNINLSNNFLVFKTDQNYL